MNNNYVLPDNSFFQRNNAIIAHIANQNGPYPRSIFDPKLSGFDTLENAADVLAGDYCYTGNEQGKVSAVTNSGGILTITVKFSETVKAAGVAAAAHNPVRTVVYKFATAAAAGTTPNRVAFQSLDNQGCVWFRAVHKDAFGLTKMTLIKQGVTPQIVRITLDGVLYAGASVQRTVNGTNVGSPVVTDSGGLASFANAATTGQLVRFVVSKPGKPSVTFGPYTVLAP